MRVPWIPVPIPLAFAATTLFASEAGGTTLVRQGLDRLTAGSEAIVQARVLDIHSYWNAAHDFILTDVRLLHSRTLKGSPAAELTLTVMGGSVADLTALVLGAPDLAPGSEYVLFLARADLPGAANRLTVHELSQGVFDVVGGRAVSQAIDESLLPDAGGSTAVPGGREGLALDELIRQIRAYTNR